MCFVTWEILSMHSRNYVSYTAYYIYAKKNEVIRSNLN